MYNYIYTKTVVLDSHLITNVPGRHVSRLVSVERNGKSSHVDWYSARWLLKDVAANKNQDISYKFESSLCSIALLFSFSYHLEFDFALELYHLNGNIKKVMSYDMSVCLVISYLLLHLVVGRMNWRWIKINHGTWIQLVNYKGSVHRGQYNFLVSLNKIIIIFKSWRILLFPASAIPRSFRAFGFCNICSVYIWQMTVRLKSIIY